MPTSGLSLVGFLGDPKVALRYLRYRCVPDLPDRDDAALEADWRAARERLGAPPARAGHPEMQPIPSSDPHIQALLAVNWALRVRTLLDQGATFQRVEIAPLLAWQISVDCDKSEAQCAGLSHPPSHEELMRLSFPLEVTSGAVRVSREPRSIIVKSDSLNLVIGAEGPMPLTPHVIGVDVGWTLPLVQVVRLNGRCIMYNGYNRAFGASLAGASEIPCLFRDVPDAVSAGLQGQGLTIPEAVLMSDNPPTLAHFTGDRAAKVRLRQSSRVIQVNWSQHTLYEE